ncbi:MAG: 50S ribosomal protein L6, partial [Peptoniphilus rhinitidis]
MSRIGKKPIEIPKGVDIKVDGQTVTVKGPKGELTQSFDKDLKIELNDGVLTVERPNEIKRIKALHGLTRTLIYNMIIGVTEGYSKSLEIIGTGYRAAKKGKV